MSDGERTAAVGGAASQQIVVGIDGNLGTAAQEATEQEIKRELPAESSVIKRNRRLGYIVVELRETASVDTDSLKTQLRDRDDVEFSEDRQTDTPSREAGVAATTDSVAESSTVDPDDPNFLYQYAPENVKTPGAWEYGFGDEEVVIGISDFGVKYDHEDLAANMDTSNYDPPAGASSAYDSSNHGWDFSTNRSNDDETDPYPADLANERHGSRVAGCAGAVTDNGTGIAGISNCSVLSLRTLDPGNHDDVADALQWAADRGVDIVNMSHGGVDSDTKRLGVQYAADNGVLMIAAAGNHQNEPDSVDYPAAYDEVIAVSSVDSDDNLADHSSIGPEIELAAPGENVWTTTHKPADEYGGATGTSFAAPMVAGVAGLVLSADPTLSTAELRSVLQDTADDIGLPDNEQGYGRVNARASVEAVRGSGELTFSSQTPDTGAVGVESVATGQESTVVISYASNGEEYVAGVTRDANNLSGETVTVTLEDSGGFPGTHTAWVFADSDVPGDLSVGDTITSLTSDALDSGTAELSSGPLSVTAGDVTMVQGGSAEIAVTAEHADQVTIQRLWTDWTVSNVSADGGQVEDRVSTEGAFELIWNSLQAAATPSITVEPPGNTYVGGQYRLRVAADRSDDSGSTGVVLTIS